MDPLLPWEKRQHLKVCPMCHLIFWQQQQQQQQQHRQHRHPQPHARVNPQALAPCVCGTCFKTRAHGLTTLHRNGTGLGARI